ncbi:MAG TPA: hypothetical protein VHJ38_15995 [Nitrososphaeraceae archaeon]|nr:hypothetical protein [Nitrososphaeraceae archaeon]
MPYHIFTPSLAVSTISWQLPSFATIVSSICVDTCDNVIILRSNFSILSSTGFTN